jgi:hypothetical protein
MGDVSLEQRHAAPLTERMGHDLAGQPAVLSERGYPTQPLITTTESAGGRTTTIGSGADSGFRYHSFDKTFDVSLIPQGVAASHELLNIAGSEQRRATLSAAFGRAQENVRTSHQRLGESVASTTSEALQVTQAITQQTGDQKVEAARASVRHSLGSATERALHQSETFSEVQRQADEKGVDLRAGLGWNYIGVIGGHVQMGVRDAHGKDHTFSLGGDSARRFTEAFGRETSRDTALQHSLAELRTAARQHGITFTLAGVQQRQAELSTAQGEQQRASRQKETADSIGRLVDRKELGDYLDYRWRETGHVTPLADARTNVHTQAEAIAFLQREHETILEGGRQLDANIREYIAAHPQEDATAIENTIRERTRSLSPVSEGPIPPPGSQEDFHRLHGDRPSGPSDSPALRREVERGLAGSPPAAWRSEAERAHAETRAVPSADNLQGDLESRGGTVTERSTPQQIGEAWEKVKHEGKDLVKKLPEPPSDPTLTP